MKKIPTLFLAIASLALANGLTYLTLKQNQATGIYPVDADSISLPIMEGLLVSAALLIFLGVAILIPRKGRGRAFGVFLSAIAAVGALLEVVAWSVPHHYTIAAAYGMVTGVSIIIAINIARGMAANTT
jgi:uncharacterized membrane protein